MKMPPTRVVSESGVGTSVPRTDESSALPLDGSSGERLSSRAPLSSGDERDLADPYELDPADVGRTCSVCGARLGAGVVSPVVTAGEVGAVGADGDAALDDGAGVADLTDGAGCAGRALTTRIVVLDEGAGAGLSAEAEGASVTVP